MAAPLAVTCLRRLGYCKLIDSHILHRVGYQASGIHHSSNKDQSAKESEDFFGIVEDQNQISRARHGSDESASKETNTRGQRTIETERKKLLRSLERKKTGKELVLQTDFGQVRIDGKTRKSFEEVNSEQFLRLVSSAATVGSETDRKGPPETAPLEKKTKKKKNSRTKEKMKTTENRNAEENFQSTTSTSAMNYVDGQYFGTVSETFHDATVANVKDQPERSLPEDPINLDDDVPSAVPTQRMTPADFSYMDNEHYPPVKDIQHQGNNFIDEEYFPTLTADLSYSSEILECNGIDKNNRNSESDARERSQSSPAFSYIDEQYFPPQCAPHGSSAINQGRQNVNPAETDDKMSEEKISQISSTAHPNSQASIPSIDDCVNPNSISDSTKWDAPQFLPEGAVPYSTSKTMSQPNAECEQPSANSKFNFIDEQYFENQSDVSQSSLENTAMQYGVQSQKSVRESTLFQENQAEMETDRHTSNNHFNSASVEPTSEFPGHRKSADRPGQGVEEVEDSAYQTVMKMRKNLRFNLKSEEGQGESGEVTQVSSIQRLKKHIPDLEHMPVMEVTQLLANSVLFENDDFLAISKPYGLPSHGGPGVRVSVGQVLEPLSRRLDKGQGRLESLHLVHRLDKETTGVMLLAKNAEVAWQLLGMFRRREVGKTYWTVTKGLPQPLEGVIDIPLAREKVNGVYKTVVKPKEYISDSRIKTRSWSRRSDRSMAAVTEYKVLAHRDSLALVECRPLTGVQHQIRAHMAQALNCPVVGDHKYSHMDRLAPQKLFPEALQKLGLRQAQVRHLPMHLHAKALVLPEWRGRTNFFLSAPVPRFFLRNLKALKIKLPQK